ncbi:hypothetical protein JCM11491_006973 [Sporobolomyces phaffii]
MVGFADLLFLSAALSPDDNPYATVSRVMKKCITPDIPRSGVNQLYFLIAVHGFLLVRWRKKLFWVFRRHCSSGLILPHFSILLGLVTVVILPLFEVLFIRSIQTFQDPVLPRDYGYIVIFVWYVLSLPYPYTGTTHAEIAFVDFPGSSSPWWICEVVVWGLAASYLVELSSKGVSVEAWSHACTVIGFASPVVVLVITLVYTFLGGEAYYDAVTTFGQLDALLSEYGAAWKPGDEAATLPSPPVSLFTTFEAELMRVSSTWRGSFLFQGLSGGIEGVVLVCVAIPYLVSLRRSIAKVADAYSSSSTDTQIRHQRQLESTWMSLLIILVAFAICSFVAVALSFVIYALPFTLQNPRIAQAALFIPFWTTGILGLPAGWLLFWRAYQTPASEDRQQRAVAVVDKDEWSLWSTVVGHASGKRREDAPRTAVSLTDKHFDAEEDANVIPSLVKIEFGEVGAVRAVGGSKGGSHMEDEFGSAAV